jgi:DNA-binding PadR family transcriptional regulator
MKKHVEKGLSHFWKMSYSQIYPTLSKFVEEDLVTVALVEVEKGPNSKLYTLTSKGQLELEKWLILDVEDINTKDETQLKFYLSSSLPIEIVIEKAERSLAYSLALQASYSSTEVVMKETKRPTRHQLNEYLAVRKGVLLNEARVKWAQECVDVLKWYQSLE